MPLRRAWLLLALACLAPVVWAAPTRRLAPDGRWVTLTIAAPGARVPLALPLRSGCRYRLTAEPLTLPRPVVDLAFGDAPPERFGAAERGQPAVREWDAEGTLTAVAEVSGFSAMVGTLRVKLEALGPDGTAQARPEPWLAPTTVRARVGDLLLGDRERWMLVLEAGRPYEIEPVRGSVLGLSLRVLADDGSEVARSLRPWLPFDTLRLRAPAAAEPGTLLPRLTLEVRGQGGCGGTYGLRLRALPDDAPLLAPPSEPPPAVEAGLVPDVELTFRANPGDVALLFTPRGADAPASSRVEERAGARWGDAGPQAAGGTLRTQEGDAMACFRPERPGTYRFVPLPPGSGAQASLQLIAGRDLGGAPTLLGIAADPRVRAKVGAAWQTLGLAVVAPGFDYLFVAVDAPEGGVALRVSDLDGATLATRPASGAGLTAVAGMGPSLRFRARSASLLRLEARGSGQIVSALLRRASN